MRTLLKASKMIWIESSNFYGPQGHDHQLVAPALLGFAHAHLDHVAPIDLLIKLMLERGADGLGRAVVVRPRESQSLLVVFAKLR